MKICIKTGIALSVLLGGCAHLDAPMSPNSGNFAAVNFEAQVVDARPAEGAPEMDAAMSAAAIERYRTGKTKTSNDTEEEGPAAFLLSPAN